jgi:hypothetical protein
MINIEINYGNFLKTIEEQLPFLIAQTLTKTALEGQKLLRDKMTSEQRPGGSGFYLRRQWIVNGVRVETASKSKLFARIYFTDYDSKYMNRQEDGGTKTLSGKKIAIPLTNLITSQGVSKGAVAGRADLLKSANKPRAIQNAFILTSKKNGFQYLVVREQLGKFAGTGKKGQIRSRKDKNGKSALNFKYKLVGSEIVKQRLGMKALFLNKLPQIMLRQFEEAILN